MFEKNIHEVREVVGRTGQLPGAHTLQLENCTSHTHEPCRQVGGELLSQQRWPNKPLGTKFPTLAESAHRCPPHAWGLQIACEQMMIAKNGVLPSYISWTQQNGWLNSPLLKILAWNLCTPKVSDNSARKPEITKSAKASHGHQPSKPLKFWASRVPYTAQSLQGAGNDSMPWNDSMRELSRGHVGFPCPSKYR